MNTAAANRPRVSGRLARIALATALAAVVGFAGAQRAEAFEIVSFGGSATDLEGNPLTQAGAHPDLTTTFEVSGGANGPDANFKDIEVDLPPGLVVDPSATPTCTQGQLGAVYPDQGCPETAQVGRIDVQLNFSGVMVPLAAPIYNLVPPTGVPARLGANIASVLVNFDGKVRSGGDYGITTVLRNNSQSLPVQSGTVVLWGVPADGAHDPARTCTVEGVPHEGCGTSEVRRPLVSNPTDCTAGPLTTTIRVNSWQHPGVTETASFDSDFKGNPFRVTGCESVQFEPTLTVQPQSHMADTPTGLDVSLKIPQSDDPDGYSSALLNRATVTLPAGMAVNPSSADGLAACTPAQIGLENDLGPTCPDAAKIATANIDTPLLEQDLEGGVYLAKQRDNPFNSTLAIYLVAEIPGVVIKLPGKISPDPVTGQLQATFDDNPQSAVRKPEPPLRRRSQGLSDQPADLWHLHHHRGIRPLVGDRQGSSEL